MSPPPERIDTLMRRHFIIVGPDDPVEEVLHLMRLARVRILPVVSEGVLLGTVSYRTLALSYLQAHPTESACSRGVVAELMERSPGTVAARAPTRTAARRLWEEGTGCLPVVEPGETGPRIVGLLTEKDLLAALYS